MAPRVIEGTWEEVVRHGDELAGCRVRLTVLDEPPSLLNLDRVVTHLIEEAERLTGASPSISAPEPEDWGGAVAEKFRRQGFCL
jgi:hypothetical protein